MVQAIAGSSGIPEADSVVGGSFLFNNVDVGHVIKFISKFKNHEASALTQTFAVNGYIEDRSDTTLKNWDVLVVGLDGSQAGELDDALIVPIRPQRRTAGARSNADSIKIGDKQRVSSRGIERAGLSDDEVSEAEAGFAGRNTPDKRYRKLRTRPLLMLHLVRVLEPKGDAASQARGFRPPAAPVLAWGISFPFPPDDEPEEVVEYMVTTTWLREQVREDLMDDEAAGDAN